MGTPPYLFSWEGGPFTPDELPDRPHRRHVQPRHPRLPTTAKQNLDIEVRELELTVAPVVTQAAVHG
jgi:hypothetical protein